LWWRRRRREIKLWWRRRESEILEEGTYSATSVLKSLH